MERFFLAIINKIRLNYLLVLLAILFFFIYSYLPLSSIGQSVKFTSPDETANYYFTKLFAEKSQLSYSEPLNVIADGFIKPRSMGFVNDQVVPVSFLGMPIYYGLLAKIFGTWIILFLTPLISVFGILFFYKLIKKIFSQKTAFYSSLLLLIQPVFWYYSEKGMWHNAPFISLLIIGFYFLTNFKRNRLIDYILCGVFLGLALAFRTSELLWVGLIVLATIISCWPKIRKSYLFLFFISGIIMFIPIIYFQKIIFGSGLALGYSRSIVGESDALTALQNFWQKIKSLFLPFGFYPERFWSNFYYYSISFLFTFFGSALLGFLLLGKRMFLKKLNGIRIFYLISFLLVSLWLIFFYGSYNFREFLDPSAIVFGSSYFRYWLPIYVFGLPFLVIFIFWLKNILNKYLRKVIWILVICIIIFSSFYLVILDPYYGVKKIKSVDLAGYQNTLKVVTGSTEANSVIVAGPEEKSVFPERRVIAYDFNRMPGKLIEIIPKLWQAKVPIYYINLIPAELEYLNSHLKVRNLNFEFSINIDKTKNLYKLVEISP